MKYLVLLIGDGDMPEQAGGEYVLVDVTVRNTGQAPCLVDAGPGG